MMTKEQTPQHYTLFLIEEKHEGSDAWTPLRLNQIPISGATTYGTPDKQNDFPYSPYLYASGADAYAAMEALRAARQQARASKGKTNKIYLKRDWRLKMLAVSTSVVDHTLFKPIPPRPPCTGFEHNKGQPGAAPCCARAGQYNGYGSDGPLLFDCPADCACHD